MHEAATGLLLKPGDHILVRVEIVTTLATGYRVKVAGMTQGLTNYFCVDRDKVVVIPAAP